MVAQSVMKITQIVLKVLGVMLCRHLVHAWGTVLTRATIGFQKKIIIQKMIQVVEYQIRIVFSLFGYSLKFR